MEWPLRSWGRQKVCSFCPQRIAARYDEVAKFGWFGFVPKSRDGTTRTVILGCPEHRKVAEEVSLLWIKFIEHKERGPLSPAIREYGFSLVEPWPTLDCYMAAHGFDVVEPKGRGFWDVGVPQRFFRLRGNDGAS